MMRFQSMIIAAVFLWPGLTRAESVIQGDLLIDGRLAVGTLKPSARLHIRGGRSGPSFLVSGVDMTPFLEVSTEGFVGFLHRPMSPLDIGSADDSFPAVLLREVGGAPQLAMSAEDGKDQRHSIAADFMKHDNAQLSFAVWSSSAGSKTMMAVQSGAPGPSRVHIRPVGAAVVDLEISNGVTAGGGRLHRRREVSPASEQIMSHARVLSRAEEAAGAHDLRTLKYAAGQSGPQPVYENIPASIRRSDGFVSVDARVTNAELAMKELSRRISRLQAAAKRRNSK
jgi:hypothetical protein